MALADTARLIASLELQDKFTRTAANAEQAMDRLDRKSGLLGGSFGRIGDGLGQMGRGVGQVGTGFDKIITSGAIVAAAGLGAVLTAAVSFEDAFAGVRKTVDATEGQFGILEDRLRGMARTMPVSFEELAGIAEQGGALGIAFEGLDEFTKVVADLAATTDLTAEAAATSLGVLSNVLGLSAEDFDNFGSALVDLGNKGASTESAILDIAERIGATGALIGLSSDQVLGYGAAVANVGIEAEAGGSALQRFFIDALTAVESGGEDLETFARTAGVSAESFRDSFRDDAGAALADFIEGLGQLPEAVQIETLADLGFNDVRITRTLLGLATDADNLTDSLSISADAFAENSALSEEAAKRYATTASQLKILKQNVLDAAVVIGEQLLPVVGELTTEFVGFLNKPGTQTAIKDFAESLAGGIREFIGEIKKADFGPLLEVLKGAAGIARGAFDAFRALPPGVQALALAAFGINKVTGGALGDIAKGFGNIFAGGFKIVFDQFMGRGSPTNPMFVVPVGGGIGGGVPGVGGGGGFLGGLGRGLATGGILGGAAALTGIAAVEVVNFQEMRTEGQAGLQASLDGMRRDDVGNVNRSIAAIDAQINMERPLLEGLLFTTNIKPQLDLERAELVQTRTDLARNIVRGTDETSLRIDGVNSRLDQERAATAGFQAADAARIASLRDSQVAAAAAAAGYQAADAARIQGLRDSHNAALAKLDTSNAYLANISAKNFAPIVKVDLVNSVSISATLLEQRLITARVAANGTPTTPGLL